MAVAIKEQQGTTTDYFHIALAIAITIATAIATLYTARGSQKLKYKRELRTFQGSAQPLLLIFN